VNGLRFWPRSASAAATEVDHLFIALLVVSFLVLGLVFGLMIYFGTKYRAGSTADRSDEHLKSWRWEVAWTAVTLLMFLALFFWGGDLYARLYRPPPNALDIYIVGKQWMWKAQHADGQAEINELHVPVGRPVRLVMTSQDVIHSFYVPAFRLKHDVLPGRYEMLWFEATVTGTYPLFCAEFCGTDHSQMGAASSSRRPPPTSGGWRRAVPPRPWRSRAKPSSGNWAAADATAPTAPSGRRLSKGFTAGRFRSRAAEPSSRMISTSAIRSCCRNPKSRQDMRR
jgi:cytochrome c oxidase subunit II